MGVKRAFAWFALTCFSVVGMGCSGDPMGAEPVVDAAPEAGPGSEAATPDASDEGEARRPTGPAICRQARGPQLQARLRVMSSDSVDAAAPQMEMVYVGDLLQRFLSICGACHGPTVNGFGKFQIGTPGQFKQEMTAARLANIMSDGGPSAPKMMPPVEAGGRPYRDRPDTDPVKEFGELVQAWLSAGSPDSFVPPSTMGPTTPADAVDYTLSEANANAMTGIGNCIPTPALMSMEETRSAKLDALFADAKKSTAPDATAAERLGLPLHLSETDLFTLDSRTLAKYGVIAFAPGYPLWSDNAGKLRHIRVPRGTSVHFDKATQKFEIPPNTRFYKTFLKPVVELDNSIRWKKMETRLIVARPNPPNNDDTNDPPALYGAYKWNDAETEAVLVQTPLLNSKPFADTVIRYVVDEPLAANVLLGQPGSPERALLESHASRDYAIPSSDRCVECHRGSPGRDFVLGFTPLQINRRPVGVGGVIETSWPDELTQLQRFIDYGVITGIDSISDVALLENSEGTRKPRNDHELVAQGYMVGNCAHCHNPHGDPSVANPELVPLLNFLPGPEGGIFQFPLDRYSPRIPRGVKTSVRIPYITPSLLDYPDPDAKGTDTPPFISGTLVDLQNHLASVIYAPWRSLIYRNVDAAFAYTYDLALFPHMPRNTPGYDPRAKQIMSDWMVSIPAVRKRSFLPEYLLTTNPTSGDPMSIDNSEQPYEDLPPNDPGYEDAVRDANARLEVLHTGVNPELPLSPDFHQVYSRYDAPGDAFDILDPAVLADPICHPIPTRAANASQSPYPFPEHPHWVTTDLSERPGAWAPRRFDWPDALVHQKPTETVGKVCKDADAVLQAKKDEQAAIKLLQDPGVTLALVRDFVTKKMPYGLWDKKTGCHFGGPDAPTVADVKRTGTPPVWMSNVRDLKDDAPVYSQTPGAAIFKMICINCHGPLADSHGRMAQNLATMTGGLSRVANFRDGLFGPVDDPGAHIKAEFPVNLPEDASDGWTHLMPEDIAARYMAWMALGGTKANVPQDVLTIVSATKVLGTRRRIPLPGSANMLSNAKQICLSLLGPHSFENVTFRPQDGRAYLDVDTQFLIRTNGDAEMWMKLCSLNNPSPIHVVHLNGGNYELSKGVVGDFDISTAQALISREGYTEKVGNEHGPGDANGPGDALDTTNPWPWCVDNRAAQTTFPRCPPNPHFITPDEANAWAVRGAINAGLAVFLYVQNLETHPPDPDYDQCEKLP